MPKSFVSLLCAAALLCAVFSAHSVAVSTADLPVEQGSSRSLLLKAANPRLGAVEPGKMRIPIPVDGVVYEVVVATPGAPRLVHAKAQ